MMLLDKKKSCAALAIFEINVSAKNLRNRLLLFAVLNIAHRPIQFFFVFCLLHRVTTSRTWRTTTPPQTVPPPQAASRRSCWKSCHPSTLTSIWCQTCWSPSAPRRDSLDLLPTCCRVWDYICLPTLIPHKGQEVESVFRDLVLLQCSHRVCMSHGGSRPTRWNFNTLFLMQTRCFS